MFIQTALLFMGMGFWGQQPDLAQPSAPDAAQTQAPVVLPPNENPLLQAILKDPSVKDPSRILTMTEFDPALNRMTDEELHKAIETIRSRLDASIYLEPTDAKKAILLKLLKNRPLYDHAVTTTEQMLRNNSKGKGVLWKFPGEFRHKLGEIFLLDGQELKSYFPLEEKMQNLGEYYSNNLPTIEQIDAFNKKIEQLPKRGMRFGEVFSVMSPGNKIVNSQPAIKALVDVLRSIIWFFFPEHEREYRPRFDPLTQVCIEIIILGIGWPVPLCSFLAMLLVIGLCKIVSNYELFYYHLTGNLYVVDATGVVF